MDAQIWMFAIALSLAQSMKPEHLSTATIKVVRALLSDYVFTGILVAQSGTCLLCSLSQVTPMPTASRRPIECRAPREINIPRRQRILSICHVGRIIRFSENYRLSLLPKALTSSTARISQQLTTLSMPPLTASAGPPALPLRFGPPAANFGTPRTFVSGSPSFTFNSSYNREFQLGIRFDF